MLVVNADSIVEELVSRKFPARRVFIVPNCVGTCVPNGQKAKASADLSAFGIPNGQRVVGLVGNLRKVKNHLMFVDGLSQVLAGFPDTRGVIIGQPIPDEADYPEQITTRIAEHGLSDKIFLAGFYPNIPAMMHRFSVFCLTSDYEGTPNVILEAMAASRPVVATRVGGVPDLVQDGVTGFLVNPGDVDGFAAAVKVLLDNPSLAERMGRAGRELAERKYSCEHAAKKLATLYLDALET
ncbi:MAG: glycosyltransferase family 4 protein [Chloroflexota bacterium]